MSALAQSAPPQAEPAASETAGAPFYAWATDLLQSFRSLLEIAAGLTRLPSAETDAETGTPLLNLYLVVCALDQILSDYLHGGFFDFTRVGLGGRARRSLSIASKAQNAARQLQVRTMLRSLQATEANLSDLALALARQVLSGATGADLETSAAVERLANRRFPAGLQRARLKLPQSFRGVELYPDDCALLGRRAHAIVGAEPVAVVGLRTSGLYMAPLAAAAMQLEGRAAVSLMSIRPGGALLSAERRRLQAIARAGGWVFVVDDPTWRGSAFATTSAALAALGFAPDRIVLAACEIANQPVFRLQRRDPTFSPAAAGAVWQGFPAATKAVLATHEWAAYRFLAAPAVKRFLNRAPVLDRLGALSAEVVRVLPFSDVGDPPSELIPNHARSRSPRQRRFHIRQVFEVQLQTRSGPRRELIAARGAGLGFFGYHSYLAAQAVAGWVPTVLGIDSGFVFQRWHAGEPVASLDGQDLEEVASYVADRAMSLELAPSARVSESRLVLTGSRQVARLLSRTMGRAGGLAQFRAANRLSAATAGRRRVLVDARMGPAEWLRSGSGRLVKLDSDEHGTDITDLCVWDPVYDLAAATVGFRLSPASAKQLVEAYARASGESLTEMRARLAVQQLQCAGAALSSVSEHTFSPRWRHQREQYAIDLVAAEELLARAVNEFLAAVFLQDVRSRKTGDVWALDLDDTLEGDRMGAPTMSAAGARAVRALLAHDAVVLLTSGRSLPEVRERCALYGLPGGIAEYGAVAWDSEQSREISLLEPHAQAELQRLRESILCETDILVDPRYEHTLRLFRHTPDGRRGMPAAEIEAVIERRGITGLEVIEGFRKTVVWVRGTEKAAALPALLQSLGIDRRDRRLHAVGDEYTDFGLMAAADHAHAPANATAAVRDRSQELRIKMVTAERGAGVLRIVKSQLRHPRRCRVCGSPALTDADSALLEVLALQDRRRAGRLAYALVPATLAAFEMLGT